MIYCFIFSLTSRSGSMTSVSVGDKFVESKTTMLIRTRSEYSSRTPVRSKFLSPFVKKSKKSSYSPTNCESCLTLNLKLHSYCCFARLMFIFARLFKFEIKYNYTHLPAISHSEWGFRITTSEEMNVGSCFSWGQPFGSPMDFILRRFSLRIERLPIGLPFKAPSGQN